MSETTSPKRGLRIAFAVSLGFNILILGLVAGAFLQADGAPTRLAVTPDFRQSIDALPEAEQLALRQAMRSAASDRAIDRAARIDAMRRFAQAVRADPMDRATIEALYAQRQDYGDALRSDAQSLLLDTLENLPVSERIAFLERLQELQRRRPRNGDRAGPAGRDG